MIKNIKRNRKWVISTHHKFNLDFIGDVFKALEADSNPIPSVVQVTQVQDNDLIAFLLHRRKTEICITLLNNKTVIKFLRDTLILCGNLQRHNAASVISAALSWCASYWHPVSLL